MTARRDVEWDIIDAEFTVIESPALKDGRRCFNNREDRIRYYEGVRSEWRTQLKDKELLGVG